MTLGVMTGAWEVWAMGYTKWTLKNQEELRAGINKKLHPAVSSTTKNILLCSYRDCHIVAWKEFSLPVMDVRKNEMIIYVFCSHEHQMAQLSDWGEL